MKIIIPLLLLVFLFKPILVEAQVEFPQLKSTDDRLRVYDISQVKMRLAQSDSCQNYFDLIFWNLERIESNESLFINDSIFIIEAIKFQPKLVNLNAMIRNKQNTIFLSPLIDVDRYANRQMTPIELNRALIGNYTCHEIDTLDRSDLIGIWENVFLGKQRKIYFSDSLVLYENTNNTPSDSLIELTLYQYKNRNDTLLMTELEYYKISLKQSKVLKQRTNSHLKRKQPLCHLYYDCVLQQSDDLNRMMSVCKRISDLGKIELDSIKVKYLDN